MKLTLLNLKIEPYPFRRRHIRKMKTILIHLVSLKSKFPRDRQSKWQIDMNTTIISSRMDQMRDFLSLLREL